MSRKATIFLEAQQCAELLGKLAHEFDSDTSQEARSLSKRFGEWCDEVGAQVEGPQSLDDWLRDDSKVKKSILECLGSIEATLREPLGPRLYAQAEAENPALMSILYCAGLGKPLIHVEAMIDILVRAKVVIQYERAQNTKLSEEDLFLREHDKLFTQLFPGLAQTPRSRLIEASLQRRRLLKQTQDYHKKLNIAMKIPQTRTNYTAPDGTSSTKSHVPDPDLASTVGRTSSTFSASDILGDMPSRFRVPPLPEEVKEDCRVCIACLLPLPIPNEDVWKNHILQDLQPYICTFENCTCEPGKLYSSRESWFEHELYYHWRQWRPLNGPPKAINVLDGCLTTIETPRELQRYMPEIRRPKVHLPYTKKTKPVDMRAAMSSKIIHNAKAHCPFCQKEIYTSVGIEKHIGGHLEQIALMALPSTRDGEPDFGEKTISEDNVDVHQDLPEPGNFPEQEHAQSESDMKTEEGETVLSNAVRSVFVYRNRGIPMYRI